MVQNETSVVPARRPSNVVSRVLRKWNLSAGTYVLLTLWLFGLFCVFLFPPPMTITPQMQFLYEKEMEEALTLENQLIVDMRLYQIAKFRTDHAKIWFWRFQKEAREEVRKMQLLEKEAWRNVERSKRNYEAALAEANSQLGIWTSFGIERTRHLFWQAYQKGKIFAQQHTLFDIIYNLPNSRDADAIGQILYFLAIAVANFTTAMISALLLFIFQLPSFIASFQPGLLSGVLFFVVSVIAGWSVMISFLALLYGSSIAFVLAVRYPQLRSIEAETQRRLNQRSD